MPIPRKLLRPLLIAAPIALILAQAAAWGQSKPKINATKLADGVYEIEHEDAPAGFDSGNTTVIIGERQVFVVDSCFLPSAARADIAQIRQWTDKPVSFVLNTHFHNDHNLGNRAYMDAFPAVTIIAHEETKKDMDRHGPRSVDRVEKANASIQPMLDTGKTKDGRALTADETTELKNAMAERAPVMEELRSVKFQSATLTFGEGFTVDLGNREVQVKFLGRGNTAGDAIVYLPREKIIVAGDLLVYPVPYVFDGYPNEWIQTLEKMGQLDSNTIVPGHGPILHDKTYLYLVRDLLKSAVDQMDAQLTNVGPAMFRTLDDVKGSVDLSSFRERFAGNDEGLKGAFDQMTGSLVKVVFEEASLR